MCASITAIGKALIHAVDLSGCTKGGSLKTSARQCIFTTLIQGGLTWCSYTEMNSIVYTSTFN